MESNWLFREVVGRPKREETRVQLPQISVVPGVVGGCLGGQLHDSTTRIVPGISSLIHLKFLNVCFWYLFISRN